MDANEDIQAKYNLVQIGMAEANGLDVGEINRTYRRYKSCKDRLPKYKKSLQEYKSYLSDDLKIKEMDDALIDFQGKCKTDEIRSWGADSLDDLNKVFSSNSKVIEFNKLRINGCDDCIEGRRQSCKDGYAPPMCFNNDNVRSAIFEGLKCLWKYNKEISAQIFGVLNFEETEINCYENSHQKMKGVSGFAYTGCSDHWHEIGLSRPGCKQLGQFEVGDLSISVGEFNKTLIHELIHTIGLNHGEVPDLVYACSTLCGFENNWEDSDFDKNSKRFSSEGSPAQILSKAKESAEKICTGKHDDIDYQDDFKKFMRLENIDVYYKGEIRDFSMGFEFLNQKYNDFQHIDKSCYNYNKDEESYSKFHYSNPRKNNSIGVDPGGICRVNFFNNLSPLDVLSSILMTEEGPGGDEEGNVMYKSLRQHVTWSFPIGEDHYLNQQNAGQPRVRAAGERGKYFSDEGYLKFQEAGEAFNKGDNHLFLQKMDTLYKQFDRNPNSYDSNRGEEIKKSTRELIRYFCNNHIVDLVDTTNTNASNPSGSVDKCESYLIK